MVTTFAIELIVGEVPVVRKICEWKNNLLKLAGSAIGGREGSFVSPYIGHSLFGMMDTKRHM